MARSISFKMTQIYGRQREAFGMLASNLHQREKRQMFPFQDLP